MYYLQVEILGGPDIFIHAGSPASLECLVSRFIVPPGTVVWSRDNLQLGTVQNYVQISIDTSHLTFYSFLFLFLKLSSRWRDLQRPVLHCGGQ